MKTRSAKNKGQRLQKFVVQSLREKFGLDNKRDPFSGDIQACLMGGSGRDVKLSPRAEELIPFDIECKNDETWSLSFKTVAKWFDQAVENSGKGRIPLLICKKNHKEPAVYIRSTDFLRISGCSGEKSALIQIPFKDFLNLW